MDDRIKEFDSENRSLCDEDCVFKGINEKTQTPNCSCSVKLSILHDKTIERVVYSWDGGEDQTIPGINRQSIERLIDIPVGYHTLTVHVVDSIGIESYYTGDYTNSNGEDVIKPEITLEEKVGKIHILAQDDREISYITYRWNDEEEVKVDATDESQTIIDIDVDVSKDLPVGENKFTVSAVDKNFNMETKEKTIKLLTKPKIQKPHKKDGKLTIIVTDDIGLEFVEYKINGKTYKWVSSTGDKVKWEYSAKLEPGENDIIINARNVEGVDADTFHGRCIYTVEE